MQLIEIKKNMDSGDASFLAKTTGYSVEMVRKVLNGERNNDLIVQAAELFVKNKKSLSEQIALMCGEEDEAL